MLARQSSSLGSDRPSSRFRCWAPRLAPPPPGIAPRLLRTRRLPAQHRVPRTTRSVLCRRSRRALRHGVSRRGVGPTRYRRANSRDPQQRPHPRTDRRHGTRCLARRSGTDCRRGGADSASVRWAAARLRLCARRSSRADVDRGVGTARRTRRQRRWHHPEPAIRTVNIAASALSVGFAIYHLLPRVLRATRRRGILDPCAHPRAGRLRSETN